MKAGNCIRKEQTDRLGEVIIHSRLMISYKENLKLTRQHGKSKLKLISNSHLTL